MYQKIKFYCKKLFIRAETSNRYILQNIYFPFQHYTKPRKYRVYD